MVARIDTDSFYVRYDGSNREERRERRAEIPRRRDRRSKAEMEIETVERALARALEEARDVERNLPRLELHRSHPTRGIRRVGTSSDAPSASGAGERHILEELQRSARQSEGVIRELTEADLEPTRGSSERGWDGADDDPEVAALRACFGPQAMAHLDDVATLYRVAAGILDNRETTISRRFGDAPPGVDEGLEALAEARGSREGVSSTGGYPIDIYDPFFRNVESSPDVDPADANATGNVVYRWILLGYTPNPLDIDLRNAGILVHEALHWHVGGGHRQLGDLHNPQNYEFYLILRHSGGPPTYTKLGEFRRD
jgi:hypothetical protein